MVFKITRFHTSKKSKPREAKETTVFRGRTLSQHEHTYDRTTWETSTPLAAAPASLSGLEILTFTQCGYRILLHSREPNARPPPPISNKTK